MTYELIPIDDSEATPYHLRPNAQPVGQCMTCRRYTWAESELSWRCGMTQPDGQPCGGLVADLRPWETCTECLKPHQGSHFCWGTHP